MTEQEAPKVEITGDEPTVTIEAPAPEPTDEPAEADEKDTEEDPA